tara:strand:+ start:6057 stop:6590 length:534 start_codon:yes stop_codon:yes gene_type:complete
VCNKQIIHTIDFIYGYLDNVKSKSLINLCLKNKDKKLSNDVNHTRNEDIELPLNKDIKEIAYRLIHEYKQMYNKDIGLINFWGQVHDKNESTQLHNHIDLNYYKDSPNVSAVYYLQVPKNSGDLILEFNKNKYEIDTWVFPPEDNKFIMFPAALDHKVQKNLDNQQRIAISFNFKYV